MEYVAELRKSGVNLPLDEIVKKRRDEDIEFLLSGEWEDTLSYCQMQKIYRSEDACVVIESRGRELWVWWDFCVFYSGGKGSEKVNKSWIDIDEFMDQGWTVD